MKELTLQDLKTIIGRRDRRYDGRFYFGVRTTRIYCRPICPAKPKPENIVIFRSVSEAETHGYRPCLRCRPDAAPGSKLLDGTLNTVTRALRLIERAGDDAPGVEELAAALGVTSRHLRRLFDEHLGASPVEIMITQKLHFARQALAETALPVAEIAFASGFRSLRRFNEAFKERFRATPASIRKSGGAAATSDILALKIPIRAPYDWTTTLAYLARHEAFGIERVQAGTYRRFLPRGKSFGSVLVAPAKKGDALTATFAGIPLGDVRAALARLKLLFDTDHNPDDLPVDGKGIRVPASFDPFETAVSIVLSQLVSTTNAKARLARLVECYGQRLGAFEGAPVYAFPAPAVLKDAPLEELGLTRTMSAALRELASQVNAGNLDVSAESARLGAIKGIGPWTEAMIAMRCAANPDAFPAGDLIVRRALDQKTIDPTLWTTSRAYLVHSLWRDSKLPGDRS